jgi:hypothetical protein
MIRRVRSRRWFPLRAGLAALALAALLLPGLGGCVGSQDSVIGQPPGTNFNFDDGTMPTEFTALTPTGSGVAWTVTGTGCFSASAGCLVGQAGGGGSGSACVQFSGSNSFSGFNYDYETDALSGGDSADLYVDGSLLRPDPNGTGGTFLYEAEDLGSSAPHTVMWCIQGAGGGLRTERLDLFRLVQ